MSAERGREPTQKQRVLRALEDAGDRGLDRTAFLAPDVIDDGPPILQFAGRIAELRADGHRIEVRGRTHRCARYVLAADPAPAVVAPDEPADAVSLFDAGPTRTGSPFDPWGDER